MFLGTGASVMAAILEGAVEMLSAVSLCPKNSILLSKNLHLERDTLALISYSLIFEHISSIFGEIAQSLLDRC